MGIEQIERAVKRRQEYDQFVAGLTGGQVKITVSVVSNGIQAPSVFNNKARELILNNLQNIAASTDPMADSAEKQILLDNQTLIEALYAKLQGALNP